MSYREPRLREDEINNAFLAMFYDGYSLKRVEELAKTAWYQYLDEQHEEEATTSGKR